MSQLDVSPSPNWPGNLDSNPLRLSAVELTALVSLAKIAREHNEEDMMRAIRKTVNLWLNHMNQILMTTAAGFSSETTQANQPSS